MNYTGHDCTKNIGCDARKTPAKCFLCKKKWNLQCLTRDDSSCEAYVSAKHSIQRHEVFFQDDVLIQFICPICRYNMETNPVLVSMLFSAFSRETDNNFFTSMQSLVNQWKSEIAAQFAHEFEGIKLLLPPTQSSDGLNEMKSMCTSIGGLWAKIEETSGNVLKSLVSQDTTNASKKRRLNADNVNGENGSQSMETEPIDTSGAVNNVPSQTTNGDLQNQHGQLRPPVNINALNPNANDLIRPPTGFNLMQNPGFDVHIHVSQLDEKTTNDEIANFIVTTTEVKDKSLFEIVKLTDVNRNNSNNFAIKFASFRISSTSDVIQYLSDKSRWPPFVKIREFVIRRPNSGSKKFNNHNRFDHHNTRKRVNFDRRRNSVHRFHGNNRRVTQNSHDTPSTSYGDSDHWSIHRRNLRRASTNARTPARTPKSSRVQIIQPPPQPIFAYPPQQWNGMYQNVMPQPYQYQRFQQIQPMQYNSNQQNFTMPRPMANQV